jgi:prepilin-type N-terminal cleavage/methylation domain-containing protein
MLTQYNRSAFSLIELLVVMAIIAILSSLAIPAFNAIRGAGSLTKAANDVSGILEQARAYAMAQNTYVWVGFKKEGSDTLLVGVSASPSGTTNANNLVSISRLVRIENLQLVEAPASTARPQSNVVQLFGSGTAFPFSSGTNAFANQILRWNSRGEARLDSATLSRVIEIGLQPSANGVIRNASNYLAIQINALSGAVSVFRP